MEVGAHSAFSTEVVGLTSHPNIHRLGHFPQRWLHVNGNSTLGNKNIIINIRDLDPKSLFHVEGGTIAKA